MKKSASLSADPREGSRVRTSSPAQGEGLTGTKSSPVLVRCRATLHDLNRPLGKDFPRDRCIHPHGHQGPHFFGRA